MQPQPRSRTRLWLVIGGVVLVLAVIGAFTSHDDTTSTANTQSTPPSTPSPTHAPPTPTHKPAPTWQTQLSLSGHLSKDTITFNTPAHWRMSYRCSGVNGGTGIFQIIVKDRTGKIVSGSADDPSALSIDCPPGQVNEGTVEITTGSGVFYLSVNCTGDWTVQIQSLQ